VLRHFDQVFNVIEDHDTQFAREAVNWARQEGKLTEANAELQASLELTDADIEKLIAERTQAKKSRNFARADAIRNDLAAKGILLEDSKDGVRWKRK
jgi:cysteinyl-tRNA synthetase